MCEHFEHSARSSNFKVDSLTLGIVIGWNRTAIYERKARVLRDGDCQDCSVTALDSANGRGRGGKESGRDASSLRFQQVDGEPLTNTELVITEKAHRVENQLTWWLGVCGGDGTRSAG
mmetsp:Transcript_14395/g.39634  ORF Transcript_14395/g.39634 Transcript_14395/m.39634 type:complete len:118 (+) Transcript_14395:359-712(+)